MEIVDKIKDSDLKIIKALYDKWKTTHQGVRTYDAQSCDITQLASETGLTENETRTHIGNLSSFDFVAQSQDQVKLMPSGIKYALGHFDNVK